MADLADMPAELQEQLMGLERRYALMVVQFYDLALAVAEGPPEAELQAVHDASCALLDALEADRAMGQEAEVPFFVWGALGQVLGEADRKVARWAHLALLRARGEAGELPSPEEIERTNWRFCVAEPETVPYELAAFDGYPVPTTDHEQALETTIETVAVEPTLEGPAGERLGWNAGLGTMVFWPPEGA